MASPGGVLVLRWVLTLVGVLIVCALIWFAGPYFAFAEVKPLVGAVARLVAILIVVIVWALLWQWRQWRASRASQEIAATGVTSGANAAQSRGSAVSGADAQLEKKFQEAMTALGKPGRGAQTLLEQPWYVIIGPPGCGKTTAFRNSGLEFPLEARFGKEAIRGVGGTRSCDWWLTKEAVLLDTAGRYMTQDSDEQADSAGWVGFLKLLKKHRRRRPINGVLLALSVGDILTLSDMERERHVLAIRRRLEELHRHLGTRLPVYVVLTKADLIAGFNEYFDDLNQSDRAQVWGTTFTWDDSRAGRAYERVGPELDELVGRLAARVSDRLQLERDAGRRRAIFAFPQQVASLKSGISTLIRDIFANATLDDFIWLRGVYLTSGTQEGTPIDRMMGALARTFRLGVQAAAAAQGRGKAFFLNRLLREVVFAEAGLAGSDRRADRRDALIIAACYLLVAFGVMLVVLGMALSYRNNSVYLQEVAAAAQPLGTINSPKPDTPLTEAVPSFDAVRQVVDVAGKYAADVPLMMRFGLYQGKTMSAAATDAYFRELNANLTPAMASHFARRTAASGAEPDRLYEYLRAYLMLGQPKRLQPAQIQQIARSEWPVLFPRDAETATQVATHFATLTSDPGRVQPVPLDTGLVERAQVSLQQASLPLLMYSRVRLSYANDTERSLKLDKELGIGASVFIRRSGVPLGSPFSALYTRAVFDEFNATGKPLLVKRFMEDSWVLGARAPAVTQTPRLAADVVQLYEQDYIKAWDGLLADIAARPARDTADAAAMLETLASTTSPLKRLLVLVEANTNLLKPPPAGDAQAAANAKLGQFAGRFDAALGTSPGPKAGSAVTQHFAPIAALVAGAPGQAPIDRLLASMGEAQQRLRAVNGLGAQPGSPQVLAAIQNALGDLQAQVGQMPPVVGGLMGDVGGQAKAAAMGVAHGDLFNRYQTQVVQPCKELVGGSYPFNRNGVADATLADFARVFGPAGVYDRFFQENVAPLADISHPTWRWREGAEAIGGPVSMLAQFQAADRIRQLFFPPGSQTPSARFNVGPDDLDADVDRFKLEVDGQVFEYHHGPPHVVDINWPGGAVGQAVASFDVRGGAHPQLAFQGPWALFRLLDQAAVQAQSPTRFLVTFRIQGKQARIDLQAASILNPLAHQEFTRFRCGG